jgi:hypothetical protein
MQNIRQILFSETEPEFKEVGWLSYEDGRLVLKFFTNDTWESISGSGGSSEDINVVDALTSTSRYDALSANQGRYLKSLIDNIPTSYNWSSIIDAPSKLSQFTNDLPLVNTTSNGLMSFNDKVKLNGLSAGLDGKTPALQTGTVTTLDPGQSVEVSITNSGTIDSSGNPIYNLNFSIPKGYSGTDGKTPIFSIGTVTTLSA